MFFFFQAEDGIRDAPLVTGVQTCALPIYSRHEGTCLCAAREAASGPSIAARSSISRNAGCATPMRARRRASRSSPRRLATPCSVTTTSMSVRAVDTGTPSRLGTILERSEEHTSELQSLMRISYAVFCLQKKKQRQTHMNNSTTAV